MKHPILSLLCYALLTVFALPRLACAEEDPAKYFEDQCLDCHHTKKKPIEDKHMTRDEWKKAVEKMLQLEKLDPVPSDQFISSMLDWLAKTHGPVIGGEAASAVSATTPVPAESQ